MAVADCLMNGLDYVDTFHRSWVHLSERGPYNSWGNGAAMRVPAVAYACDSLTDVLAQATRSAEVTHNHPEGIKGAQAAAAAVFMARSGAIIAFLESNDFEDAIRKAISLGGDADPLACITGAIAEAHYGGVPYHIASRTVDALDDTLRGVVTAFCARYRVRVP